MQTFFEHAFANNFLDVEAETIPHSFFETLASGHGRTERRRGWACAVSDQITSANRWAGLQSISLLESERTFEGLTHQERRYYISSLAPDAEKLLGAVRTHWGIENSVHWILDVTFQEDSSRRRKDNGPQNMATMRHISLNLLKKNTTRKASIKRKRQMAAWEPQFLKEILEI